MVFKKEEPFDDDAGEAYKLLGAFTKCSDCFCSGFNGCDIKDDFRQEDADSLRRCSVEATCSLCRHTLSIIFKRVFEAN